MRDRSPPNANEHGDGEVTIAAADQGFGTAGAFEPFESKETDQVLRHGTTSHQTVPEGTWVWGMYCRLSFAFCKDKRRTNCFMDLKSLFLHSNIDAFFWIINVLAKETSHYFLIKIFVFNGNYNFRNTRPLLRKRKLEW